MLLQSRVPTRTVLSVPPAGGLPLYQYLEWVLGPEKGLCVPNEMMLRQASLL